MSYNKIHSIFFKDTISILQQFAR